MTTLGGARRGYVRTAPERYAYISATADCVIDTGFHNALTDRYDFVITARMPSRNCCIGGVFPDGSSAMRFLYEFSEDRVRVNWWSGYSNTASSQFAFRDSFLHYSFVGLNAGCFVEEYEVKTIGSGAAVYPTGNITAFCSGLYSSGGDISGMTITKDGVVVFDAYPTERNGQGCLYDTVSGEYFENSGTGTITAVKAA